MTGKKIYIRPVATIPGTAKDFVEIIRGKPVLNTGAENDYGDIKQAGQDLCTIPETKMLEMSM